MKKIIRLTALFILFALSKNAVIAQRAYFVKNGYAGSNSDTVSTIQSAITKVGLTNVDTIILMPGTYSSNFINIYGLQNKKFIITSLYSRDTTKREYVAQTILDGTSQTNNNGVIFNSITGSGGNNSWTNSDSVLLSGLSIQNFQPVLNNVNGLNYLQISDCNLNNNGGSNSGLINHSSGVTEIIHCQFNNNIGSISLSYWGSSNTIKISRNKFTNHTISGGGAMMGGSSFINIGNGSSKNIIENNLFNTFSGSNTGYLIYVNYPSSDSIFIRNNTFYQNEVNSIKFDAGSNTSTITILQNNIFNSNNLNSTSEFSFGTNVKVRWFNNVTYLPLNRYSGFGSVDTIGGGANFVMQDLKFVSNFYPGSNSPFIGLGLPTATPTLDLDGKLRPSPNGSAPEIGCFEINKSLTLVSLLNLESNGTRVKINWTSNRGPNDKGFAIYRSTSNVFSANSFIGFVNSNSANSYIDSNTVGNDILIGTRYFYSVRKVGSVLPVADTSDISNVLSVTPSSTIIAAPNNLQAIASPSKIKLIWSASNTASSLFYNIYRSESNDDMQLLATGLTSLSYIDASIKRNVNYKYAIKAYNSNNNTSSFSDSVVVATTNKNIWYVAPNGNDSELGSENLPFQTISFALQNVISGDTVLLKKGTYTSTALYQLDSNIVIMSYFPINNDSSFLTETIIEGAGGNTNGLITGSSSRISLSGLTIQNVSGSLYYQINNWNSGKVFILNQNIIKDNNNWNTLINSNPNSIFRNNTFLNNRASISFQGTTFFEGNTVWANSSNSMGALFNINSSSVGKYFFNNNRFVYSQSLIQINNSNISDSIFFTNNTFIYKNNNSNNIYSNSSAYSIYFNENSYRCFIRNNIFYPTENFSFALNSSSNKPRIHINNNSLNAFIRSNANISNFTLADTTGNIYGVDPAFISIRNDNYKLNATSALIGRGMIFDRLPANDLLSAARAIPLGSNPDLGSYESSFALSSPIITAIQGGNRKLNLMWKLNASNNVDSFYLYKSGPNVDNTLTQTLPYKVISKDSLAFLDSTGITNIDRYYYRLKAKDSNGNLSDTSNLIIGRANVEPVIVTNVSGDASPGMIRLDWKHVDSSIHTYNIYRGLASDSKLLYAQNVPTTFFIDSVLARGAKYYYSIQAIDSIGAASAYSSDIELESIGLKWVVDASASTIGAIGSVSRPFKTISSALRFVQRNDTLLLNSGTYREQLKFTLKPLVVISNYNSNVANSESIIQNTIIDGGNLASNVNLLLDSTNTTIGLIRFNGISFNNVKGYILNNASRFAFLKCNFNNNIGSGVIHGSFLSFDSCRFVNNGPLNNMGNNFATLTDSITLKNSFITGNFNSNNAIFNISSNINSNSSSSTITRSIIENNIFSNNGKNSWDSRIIHISSSNIILRNNIFTNNSSTPIRLNPWNYNNNSTSTSIDIINNTIISNTAEGLRFDGGNGKVNIANNIIQNNSSDIAINSYGGSNSTLLAATFTNNIIGTNRGDTVLRSIVNIANLDTSLSANNFSADFRFTDTARSNFMPSPFSKALGGAKASFVNFGYDQKGGVRPNPSGTIPDIGAIESQYNFEATTIINGEGSDRKIGIQWLPIKNNILSKFYIYRSTSTIDTLVNLIPHDSVGASISNYLDVRNVVNLTPLYYRVRAVDNNYNLSAYSNQIVVTPNLPLPPPISLNLISAPRILKLTWVDSTKKAKSFKVFRGTNLSNVSLFANGILNSSFTDSTVKKGVTYFYCVKSVDSVGAVSDSSSFVSGTNVSNIFYVDNSATTNGIGAIEDPRNSIQSAINSSVNGDTIIIKPGKYQERLIIDSAITIGSMFILNADTSFISRTIITGGTVSSTTIPGGSSGSSSSLIGSRYYMNSMLGGIVVKGLQFEQFSGSLISNYSSKITLSNCIIRSITANCNTLISAGQNSLIEKNQFFNNSGQISLNTNSVISQNKFINQISTCNNFINVSNGKIKIYNNLFNNVQGIDIGLSGGSDSNFIVNNTFYKSTNTSFQFIRFEANSSTKNFIYNNIFNKNSGRDFLFNTSSYPMYQSDSAKPLIDISYNLLDTALNTYSGLTSYNLTRSRNNFTGFSPRFINSNSNDFSLSKSSPAIGIGLDTTFVPNADLIGNMRANPVGSKPDLGAVESNVGIASPFINSYKVNDRILNLDWKIFDTVGVSSFKIYRSDIDSLPTTLIFQTTDKSILTFRDSLDYSKSYNYRIKSVKRDSTLSDFSDPVKIFVFAPPVISKPLDSSINVNLKDTLFWQTQGANLIYDIQIGKSEEEAIRDSTKLTTNKFYQVSNLLQNTYYYWRVRVRDQNTISAWSNINKFQTRVSPPVLADTNFIDNSIFRLNFKYDSTNIKFVKIYKGFDQNALELYDSLNNSFKFIDTLSYLNPTYFAVSVVNNNNVESALSGIQKIVTYRQPELLLPSNVANRLSLNPQFSWASDSLSTNRLIQISTDSTFGNFVNGYSVQLNDKQDTFKIIDSSKLLPNTVYFWRVKAGDKNGFGDWSITRTFQTFVESPIFTNVYPANKRDTLIWSRVPNGYIEYYKVYRDTMPQPSILVDSVSGSNSSYIDTGGLKLNVKYYYRLKAFNKEGIESDFSNELSATPFNTLPKVVSLANKTYNNVGEFNFVRTNYTAVGSIDLDGQITTYNWFVNDSLINDKDSILINYFNQGTNKVKLVITDNDGGKDSSSATVTLSSFVKTFEGGFLGGIAALSPNIIYTADTTYNPINGASISRLDRNGNTVYPLVVSSKIYTTPSVSSDSSVFITSGSSLNGFNKSGAPLWSTIPLGGLSYVTPTIDSLFSRIYVGVSNKNFFAIDYKTGKVVWNLIGDAPVNASAIITGDRKLVFTSQAGTLYGFDIRTNIVQTAPKWSTNFGEIITKSPAVDANNNLIIGTESGNVLKVVLNDDGTTTRTWSVSVNSPIQSSPVIDGDGFIYVGNSIGDFYKLDANTGSIIWKYETGGAIKSTPAISEFGNIYISNTNGVITALTTNKTLKWTYQADGPISANMLYINNMLYVGTEKGKFLAIYDNPSTNTVNTSLSLNMDKRRLKTYTYGSLASNSPIHFDQKYEYYYDAYKQGKFNFVYLDTTKAKEPVWGTFQGNYRRTGSKKFECPETPVIQIPNCTTPSDSIRISTNTMTNRHWIVNDVKLTNVSDRSIMVKTTDKFRLMAFNSVGCEVFSGEPSQVPNSNISKPTIIASNGSGKICEGDSLSLISSIDAAKYQWNYAGGAVTNQNSKNLKTTLAGAYSVTVTNDFGCTATSDLQLVMVNKIPSSPIVAPVVYCLNSLPTQISAVNSNTDTLVWYSSAIGGVGSRVAPTPSTSAIGTTSYYVSQINNNGCESPRSKLDVTITNPPSKPAITAAGSTSFCTGGSVVLNSSSSSGNQWFKDGQIINGAILASYTATLSGKYSVRVASSGNCVVTSDETQVLSDVSTSLSTPVINSVYSDSTICFKDSLVLKSSTFYDKYLWSNGDTTSTTVIKNSSKISLRGALNGSSCFSLPSTAIAAVRNINVIPQISAQLNSLIATNSNNYKWFKNNLIIPGVTANTLFNPSVGVYRVETSLDKFCWDASQDYMIITNTLPLLTDTVQLSVFPNPSSGIFNVVADFEKTTNVVTKVTVVDINGVVVYQSQRLLFFSKKIMLPVNLGTRKGVFGVHMDINGTVKSIVVVVN